MSDINTSSLNKHLNTKRENKNEYVKKLHQQKKTTQPEMRKGLLYKPLVKKPSKKVLGKSMKAETQRKKGLKKILKNTLSEKNKKLAKGKSLRFESKRPNNTSSSSRTSSSNNSNSSCCSERSGSGQHNTVMSGSSYNDSISPSLVNPTKPL